LNLHHVVSSNQTVATEIVLNNDSKTVDFRLGLNQKLNDDTSAKLKVNHNGYVDVLLKHKLNNVLTLGLVSGVNLKRIVSEHKSSALPLGLSLDFKL